MNKYKKNAKDIIKGSELMIKNIAWNTFKNTGNVDTFLELKQIQELQENMQKQIIQGQKAEQNGNSKNEWNNNF